MKSFMLDSTEMAFINKMLTKGFLVMSDTQAKKKCSTPVIIAPAKFHKPTIQAVSKIEGELVADQKKQSSELPAEKQKRQPQQQEAPQTAVKPAIPDPKPQKFRPTAQKKQKLQLESSKPLAPEPAKIEKDRSVATGPLNSKQVPHQQHKSPPPTVGSGASRTGTGLVTRDTSSQGREASSKAKQIGGTGSGNEGNRPAIQQGGGGRGTAITGPKAPLVGNNSTSNPDSQSLSQQPKSLSLVELARLIRQLPPKYLPGLWNVLTSFRPELQQNTHITFDLADCHPDLLVQISIFVQNQLALEESLKKRLRKEPEVSGHKSSQGLDVTVEELQMMAKSPEKYLLGRNKHQIMSEEALDARALKASARTGLRSFSSGSERDDLQALENSDSSSSTSGNTPTKDKRRSKQQNMKTKADKSKPKVVDSLAPLPISTTIPMRKRQEMEAKVRELDQKSRRSVPNSSQPQTISEPKIKYIPDSEEPVSLQAISNSEEAGSKAAVSIGTTNEISKPSEVIAESQPETADPLPTQPEEPRNRSSSPANSNDSSSFISTSL